MATIVQSFDWPRTGQNPGTVVAAGATWTSPRVPNPGGALLLALQASAQVTYRLAYYATADTTTPTVEGTKVQGTPPDTFPIAVSPATTAPAFVAVVVEATGGVDVTALSFVVLSVAGAGEGILELVAEGGVTLNPVTGRGPIQGIAASGGSDTGGPSFTVNSGPKETTASPVVPLAITSQALVQPGGHIQPLPPLFSFEFTGATVLRFQTGALTLRHICAGRDGRLYVISKTKLYICTLFTAAVPAPVDVTAAATLVAIFAGPTVAPVGGAVWMLDRAGKKFWRYGPVQGTPSLTPVAIPTLGATDEPTTACVGPDGLVWVAITNNSTAASKILRLDAAGTLQSSISLATVTTPVGPLSFAGLQSMESGPDGRVWFLTQHIYTLGAVTPEGVVSLVTPLAVGTAGGVCAGPDGQVWAGWKYTTGGQSVALRVTPNAPYPHPVVLSINLPHPGNVVNVVSGGGGDVWYAMATTPESGHSLVKITTDGHLEPFAPTNGPAIFDLCVGPDNAFWCVAEAGTLLSVFFYVVTAGLVLNSMPTADPHVDGALWNDLGVVHVSAG